MIAATITSPDGYYWLTCDWCGSPLIEATAGVSLATMLTRARDHQQACPSATVMALLTPDDPALPPDPDAEPC